MRIIAIDRYRVTKRVLEDVSRTLRAGGVVAFPTETSYGLAADPKNAKAVARVYAVKGRPRGKPLPLVAASRAAVNAAFRLEGKALAVARRHWPGPLTLVLAVRRGAGIVTAGRDGTCAVRVPSSVWARSVAAAAGGLATSTSANVSGEAAIYDARDVVRGFKDRSAAPDLVLDAGRLPKRTPSTIIRLKRGTIEVVRQGSIRVAQ